MLLRNITKKINSYSGKPLRLFYKKVGLTIFIKKLIALIYFGFSKEITLKNGLILTLEEDDDYELRVNYLSDILNDNFETQKINLIRQVLFPGDKFIDIGCSFGLFSLIASEIVGTKGEVLAFDPSSTAIKTLNINSKINGFENIRTHNIALGNSDNLIQFFGQNYGGTIIKDNPQYETSVGREIEMKKLDSILSLNDLQNLKFIKIDAEGAELEILKGAENILKNSKDLVITIELGEMMLTAAGSSIEEVVNFLISLGYFNFIDITHNERILPIQSSNFMKDLEAGRFGSFFNPQVGFFCEIAAMKENRYKKIVHEI
tara:strand:+ start:8002 stop:8955 length:954 start_codon:yes stop_codon:yes gene_type:complete